jgi:hypothetical protein
MGLHSKLEALIKASDDKKTLLSQRDQVRFSPPLLLGWTSGSVR